MSTPPPEMPTAAILEKLLKERGITAHALSVAAGLRRDAVRAILVGRSKRPQGDTLTAIAKALGVPVDALLGRAPVPAVGKSPLADLDEYDLSPRRGATAELTPDRRIATWRVPRPVSGRPGRRVLVSLAGVDDDGAADGPRYLIDVGPDAEVIELGGRYLVWTGASHAVATMVGTPAQPEWEVGGRRFLGLLPVGRVLEEWRAD